MAIIDAHNEFSDAQLVMATANGTNVIDTRHLLDIAPGEPLSVEVIVNTLPVSGGASTLIITIVDDDNAALSSPVTLVSSASYLKAALAAGTRINIPLPRGVKLQRYVGIIYTVGTANYTAGAFDAHILPANVPSTPETYIGVV